MFMYISKFVCGNLITFDLVTKIQNPDSAATSTVTSPTDSGSILSDEQEKALASPSISNEEQYNQQKSESEVSKTLK